jgi:hypothetical protein
MNKYIIKLLKLARKSYLQQFSPVTNFGVSYDDAAYSNQTASDLIKEKLLNDEPVMICRFGSVELSCILNYYFIHDKGSFWDKSIKYIKGEIGYFWWDRESIVTMNINAGFFPPTIPMLEKFSLKMLEDIKCIDILGSWKKEEKILSKYLSHVIKIRLPDLEPYYHKNPWTEALKGKVVLVIHPYAESIKMQYEKRLTIFEDKRILPEFELKTIKAVQSIANNKTEYKSWFDAYDDMCRQISEINFDIAIIGCGAYGFPLAAHVKRIGKKSVHLGGPTQLLFGIKGKRWEDNGNISSLINEHWVKPLRSEFPENYSKVEDGCYW